MIKYVLIAVFSGIISAFSQILLKKSSSIEHENQLKEYLNPYVISGYMLMVLCLVMMVFAYKGLPFKYGAALESLVYLYTMVMSKVFLHEKITVKRLIGNLIIVCGVAVFSL